MNEQIIVGTVGVVQSFEHYFTRIHGQVNLQFSPKEAREFAARLIESSEKVEKELERCGAK